MTILNARESYFLSLIRRHGALSRRELHEQTRLRPNTVGELAAGMIERGLLREGEPEIGGPGRPRQPLEIDPLKRRVVGLAFEPGQVSACELSLNGVRIGAPHEHRVHDPEELVSEAVSLVRELCNERTLALGISTTGFVDPQTRSILTSSATQRRSPTRIGDVYAAAAGCPVVLENDMHAQATCWLLNQDVDTREDILLIDLRDGAIGSALLVGGRANRGCIIGGNELGHTRFFVDTEQCYCGHKGCLERICSSEYLRRIGNDPAAVLDKALDRRDSSDPALAEIIRHLSMGIANAINFIRPNRVVLAGQLTTHAAFCKDLLASVRALLLAPLAERVRIEVWDKPPVPAADAAAWLGLAAIYRHELSVIEPVAEYARASVPA
jgi:predicted NBD/HSP70 family sugar kinase